jgi:hypothetical protein
MELQLHAEKAKILIDPLMMQTEETQDFLLCPMVQSIVNQHFLSQHQKRSLHGVIRFRSGWICYSCADKIGKWLLPAPILAAMLIKHLPDKYNRPSKGLKKFRATSAWTATNSPTLKSELPKLYALWRARQQYNRSCLANLVDK